MFDCSYSTEVQDDDEIQDIRDLDVNSTSFANNVRICIHIF